MDDLDLIIVIAIGAIVLYVMMHAPSHAAMTAASATADNAFTASPLTTSAIDDPGNFLDIAFAFTG